MAICPRARGEPAAAAASCHTPIHMTMTS